jgi:hypothetical protein
MFKRNNYNEESRISSNEALDRLLDGKAADNGALYDHMLINQQMGTILAIPLKQSSRKAR